MAFPGISNEDLKEPSIKSLTVYPSARRYDAPVLHRSSPDEKIVISFDELTDERRYLRYELIHCDADWQREELSPSELTEGFNEGRIDDVEHSQGTVSQYVNYRLVIPNEEVNPKLSGNWVVRVYDEENPEATVLSTRFMIVEDAVNISGEVTGRTDREYNDGLQQLSVTVDTQRSGVRNVYSDLQMRIDQNGRPDSRRALSTPLRATGSKAVYEHQDGLIFDGGKEYRRFETVSTSYPGMNVERVVFHEPAYQFDLYTDYPRSGSDYEYDQTQSGRFTIDSGDNTEPDTESEYVWVNFTLDMAEQSGAEVYIEGDLTGRRYDAGSRMDYNREAGRYEKSLLLKQGSYNYQYVLKPAGQEVALTGPIEGNSYRTANEYGVAVYYRAPGDRYTRLLGYTTLWGGR